MPVSRPQSVQLLYTSRHGHGYTLPRPVRTFFIGDDRYIDAAVVREVAGLSISPFNALMSSVIDIRPQSQSHFISYVTGCGMWLSRRYGVPFSRSKWNFGWRIRLGNFQSVTDVIGGRPSVVTVVTDHQRTVSD